jgi:DNA primase
MINYDLLSLLEKVLGKGRKTSGNNYAFFSPFISHYKPKLEIDLTLNNNGENPWHCWVSNVKGRNIVTLFKKIKKSIDRSYYDELYKILNIRRLYVKDDTIKREEILELPSEYIPLLEYSKITDKLVKLELRKAVEYLKSRGVTKTDILRYNIGYCYEGKYSGRIIIPSYDDNYRLNYFVSRTIFDDVVFKHKNPNVSKDVIGFESYINWNEPITLVEGAFDAITARYNTIPMFGKIISNKLKEKLIIRRPPKIIVALDSDAYKDALNISSLLIQEGLEVSVVKMEQKDINEMGFEEFSTIKNKTTVVDSYDLLKQRILNV